MRGLYRREILRQNNFLVHVAWNLYSVTVNCNQSERILLKGRPLYKGFTVWQLSWSMPDVIILHLINHSLYIAIHNKNNTLLYMYMYMVITMYRDKMIPVFSCVHKYHIGLHIYVYINMGLHTSMTLLYM